VFFLFLISKRTYHSLNEFLSVNQPIEANVLLVEGWMSDKALLAVSEEFKTEKYERIITTGLEAPEYYQMSMNGYITFHIKKNQIRNLEKKEHLIEIDLYGETKGNNRSHVNVYINDSLMRDFYVEKRKKKYAVRWHENLSEIDSVTIQFDNDGIGSFGDRNINIKEIIIDREVVISYKNNSVYNVFTTDRREQRVNNYSSFAEIARNMLISFGVDSNKIIAVPGDNISVHRTIASAASVHEYFKLAGIKKGKINIVSIGPHARRSWITYKTILDKTNFEIGIISLDIYQDDYSSFRKSLNLLSEIVEFLYYKLVLIGYR
jgi:hypothetical protein